MARPTINRVTKSCPLELLLSETARPYGLLLPDNIEEREIDISISRLIHLQNVITFFPFHVIFG